MNFYMDDCAQGYIDLCTSILTNGERVAPRGEPTIEVQAATVILKDPRYCIVTGNKRNANLAIGAAEAAQLIGGFSDPELMVKLSPNFKNFMDDGVFYGAYGPRVRDQLPEVTRQLRIDPCSRRVRVQIWRPEDLFAEGKHDYPCTLGFTFHVRDGALNMHTHMRSNDAYWGFTYDVMQFCLLQMTVADMLNVRYGTYYHHVDSLHVYERDLPAIAQLERTDVPAQLFSSGLHGIGWGDVRRRCQMIARGNTRVSGDTARRLAQMIASKL